MAVAVPAGLGSVGGWSRSLTDSVIGRRAYAGLTGPLGASSSDRCAVASQPDACNAPLWRLDWAVSGLYLMSRSVQAASQ